MADVKIKLTDDQQKQIREATGKSVTELDIGGLTEQDLDKVVGGVSVLSFSFGSSQPTS